MYQQLQRDYGAKLREVSEARKNMGRDQQDVDSMLQSGTVQGTHVRDQSKDS